ncbi:unnamed protein product, partial [Medioppia subpectinata]
MSGEIHFDTYLKTQSQHSDESHDERQCIVLSNAFDQLRHREAIQGMDSPDNHSPHSWRMKDRMKTVSVALVLCLNVGVDPPDIIKPNPCSVLQCWVD